MLAGYSAVFTAMQAQVNIGQDTTGRVGAPDEEFAFTVWKRQAGLRLGHNQMTNEDCWWLGARYRRQGKRG
jgi:hypothetical protein